jgi:hypothetical protein
MKKIKLISAVLLFFAAFSMTSCSTGDEPIDPSIDLDFVPTVPVLSTRPLDNVLATSARSGGIISTSGGMPITEKGVVWSITQNPTITDSKTIDGSGTVNFISALTGLTPSTIYYVRAYATNSVGTAYGNEVLFITTNTSIPTIATANLTVLTDINAVSGGAIYYDGGVAVSERGVVWSTNQNPTITDPKTNDGVGTGNYTSAITGLTAGTTYYVRAYATNSVGTAYGNQITFTTRSVPTLTTSNVINITATTASSGGNISQDGGSAVTERGVVWSTTVDPTITNSKTIDGTGTGAFTSSITGLTANTTYYLRAYATNAIGTAYGNQITFVTPL